MIIIKCALVFFYECPENNIPDEELDDGSSDPIIHFSVYTYQGRCVKNETSPNVLSVCRSC